MANYYLSKKARVDLSNIWDYTVNKWSENQAERYYNKLLSHCQQIADNPALGRPYEKVSARYLGYKADSHIIFYRVTSMNEVTIIRILHGSMDLKNRLV